MTSQRASKPLVLNVQEAKTQLSRYLARVEEVETIVLCRRNRPIAELRPLRVPRRSPRPIGLDAGRFQVPATFFEPLPDEFLDACEGG